MFKRRKPRALITQLRGYFWPHIGWQRAAHYYWMRLKRLSGTPHNIAAGFAAGAASSFTPFVGFHFITAFAISFFVRGNYLAAAIGTAVGNPWTFPFIWAWIYHAGTVILGRQNRELPDFSDLSFHQLAHTLGDIFLPMLVGGIPSAIVVWLIFYFPMLRVVAIFQKRRRAALFRKSAKSKHVGETAL